MKTLIRTKLGMLGLLGALAVNSSHSWDADISGSGDFASSKNSVEKCIRKAMNRPNLKDGLFDCKIKKNGKKYRVSGTLKKGHRTDDGSISTATKDSGNIDDLFIKKDPKTVIPQASVPKIETLIAELTVAAITVPGCEDCEDKIASEKLFRDLNGGARKDFSGETGSKGQMASDLVTQAKALMETLDDDLKELKKEQREKAKLQKKWEQCKADEDGEEFEDEADFTACVDEQLTSLSGKKLRNFVNNRLFPQMMNLAFTDPERANELRQLLEDNGRDGKSGRFLNGTLTNFAHFLHDYQLLDQAMKRAKSDSAYAEHPESYLKAELRKIEQTFSNYSRNSTGNPKGIYGPQFIAIQKTLSSGKAPRGIWPISDLGGYSESGFSSDMALRSLGLPDDDIKGVYPKYRKSIGRSLKGTSQKIDKALRRSRI